MPYPNRPSVPGEDVNVSAPNSGLAGLCSVDLIRDEVDDMVFGGAGINCGVVG